MLGKRKSYLSIQKVLVLAGEWFTLVAEQSEAVRCAGQSKISIVGNLCSADCVRTGAVSQEERK
jgi:hypothetical protein